jgi:hypothetical protein
MMNEAKISASDPGRKLTKVFDQDFHGVSGV